MSNKLTEIGVLQLNKDGFEIDVKDTHPLCKGWLEDAEGNFDENNIAGFWVIFNTQLRCFAEGITWAWLPNENKTLVKISNKKNE